MKDFPSKSIAKINLWLHQDQQEFHKLTSLKSKTKDQRKRMVEILSNTQKRLVLLEQLLGTKMFSNITSAQIEFMRATISDQPSTEKKVVKRGKFFVTCGSGD
jgi:cob(I)alamin adenosyltransferase